MNYMKVYRLEMNGYGPYTYLDRHNLSEDNKDYCREMIKKHNSSNKHPTPSMIFYNLADYRSYKFGSRSLELLKQWFDGWLDELIYMGFEIHEYEVEHFVIIDDHQVVFNPENVKQQTTVQTH